MNAHRLQIDALPDELDSLDPDMFEAFHRNQSAIAGETPTATSHRHDRGWIESFVDRLLSRLERNKPFELRRDRDLKKQAAIIGELVLRLMQKKNRKRRLTFVCRTKGKIDVTLGTPLGKGGVA